MVVDKYKITLSGGLLASALVLQGCNTTSESGKTVQLTAVDRAIGKCVASVAVGAIGGAIIGAALGGTRAAKKGAVTGALIGVGRCAVLVELAAEEDKRQLRQAQLSALDSNETVYGSFVTESGKIAEVTTRSTPAPPPEKKAKKPKQPAKKPPSKSKSAPIEEAAKSTIETVNEQEKKVVEYDKNPDVKIITDNDESQDVQLTTLAEGSQSDSETSELVYLEEKADVVVCKYTEMVINMQGQSADGGKQKWCRAGDGAWEPVTG